MPVPTRRFQSTKAMLQPTAELQQNGDLRVIAQVLREAVNAMRQQTQVLQTISATLQRIEIKRR